LWILAKAKRTEQHVEDHSRIAHHWQRSCRRGPTDRVGVGAGVTEPAAAALVHWLDAQLHRRNRRVLTKPLRVQLITRRARLDVGTGGVFRVRLRQKYRARSPVIAADFPGVVRLGVRAIRVADDG